MIHECVAIRQMTPRLYPDPIFVLLSDKIRRREDQLIVLVNGTGVMRLGRIDRNHFESVVTSCFVIFKLV